MDMNTLIVLIVNLVVSAIVGFTTAMFTIGQYKNKVDAMETNIGKNEHCGFRKTMGDMKTEVDKLLEFKINAQKFIDSQIYVAHSPLNLTEYGRSLVDDSSFSAIFGKVKDDLAAKLLHKAPKTQYDVQEEARVILLMSLPTILRFNRLRPTHLRMGKTTNKYFAPARYYYAIIT